MKKTTPNPGSQEAVNMGCKCPILDNHNGEGFELKGETMFWYNDRCKIHNNQTK